MFRLEVCKGKIAENLLSFQPLFFLMQEPLVISSPRSVGPNGCADERSAVLDFVGSFSSRKKNKERAKTRLKSVLWHAALFFSLVRSFA